MVSEPGSSALSFAKMPLVPVPSSRTCPRSRVSGEPRSRIAGGAIEPAELIDGRERSTISFPESGVRTSTVRVKTSSQQWENCKLVTNLSSTLSFLEAQSFVPLRFLCGYAVVGVERLSLNCPMRCKPYRAQPGSRASAGLIP